jgi:hypothetical protein
MRRRLGILYGHETARSHRLGPGKDSDMKRALIVTVFTLVMLAAGYFFRGVTSPGPGAGSVPTVATSVDFIRQIGELHVLRASVKEIVTSAVGEATWLKTPGKLAIICHFDIKYKYDLHKARVVAGGREDGTRYCMIRLPRHEFEVSTGGIRFYDDQDGTWLGFTQKTPPGRPSRRLPGPSATRTSGSNSSRPGARLSPRASGANVLDPNQPPGHQPLDRPGLRAEIDTGLPRVPSSEA